LVINIFLVNKAKVNYLKICGLDNLKNISDVKVVDIFKVSYKL